ncbi:MAG: hypothetical protein JKY70_05680 [Mucilaginibacter sp.]|nr:hypothetical protein [Mucilaginibacter sp.]
MNKHQGKIIEYIVRKNGYNISDLARELGINRRSVYNYFGNNTVKSSVIIQIGSIIRHDFSTDFPEIFKSEDFKATVVSQKVVFKEEAKKSKNFTKRSILPYWKNIICC